MTTSTTTQTPCDMPAEDITHQERIEALESWVVYFRELLADTPDRGFDSAKKRIQIIKALNRTRDDLIIARFEAETDEPA